jgi:outer membrane protein assembly factor BamD
MRISAVFIVLIFSMVASGCFLGGKKAEVITPAGDAEPDKILYEKGLKDLEKGRFEVARLTFQTLLNTYPDSDYKEKAKLAIADSFFKQGGTSGLIQAEAEYKDFMTFFPTSDDSDDAQMRIAMTHYKQMEKPDRDRTQALAAQREFRSMIEQFPDSPLKDEAVQHLREVQEVLAEGDLRVARHYMILKRYEASISRSGTILKDYPDFSRQDMALLIMGEALERKKKIVEAGYYYGKIVSDHPLSDLADEARKKLEELNLPIPEVNPDALARAQAEKDSQERHSLMGRIASLFSKKPDVSNARKSSRPPIDLGPERVNLEAATPSSSGTPPPSTTSGGDISVGVGAEIVTRPSSNSVNQQLPDASGPSDPSARHEGVASGENVAQPDKSEKKVEPEVTDGFSRDTRPASTGQNKDEKSEKTK